MTDKPWCHWIPGVLSKKQVIELCNADLIRSVENPEQSVDDSSIDLSLSNEVYRLTEGSVKPFENKPYLDSLKKWSLLERLEPDGDIFHLKNSTTYLVKLREKLSQRLQNTRIFGQATAKSSIGRVDVLVRIIIDGMSGYDMFDPGKEGEGEIFAEITPISFDVRIKTGIALAQLRFCYGTLQHAEIRGPEIHKTCVLNSQSNDGLLSVNLEPVKVGELKGSAFEGGQTASELTLDLWRLTKDKRPKPWDFFKFLEAPKERLHLKPGSFYILRSKERLSIPAGIAVYIRAIDETLGEMRIHYAGFAHPWFGRNREDTRGTPIIFEVRGHDVPAVLLNGEKMARLTFYRMSHPAEKPNQSVYDTQELRLSSLFAEFPEHMARNEHHVIHPKGT